MSEAPKPAGSSRGAARKAGLKASGLPAQLAELHQKFGHHMRALEDQAQAQKQDVAGALGQLPEVREKAVVLMAARVAGGRTE